MIIGLTGGIACGKSTVAQMLQAKGAVLIDADRIAREVVEPGSPILAQVAGRFGTGVLQEDGSLDRKKLGEIVFADKAARKDLEAILHPAIRTRMWASIEASERERPQRLTVADIPLLYESGHEARFPEVMVVYVPEAVQLERLMARDKLTAEQAEARIRAQMPIEEKRRRADVVIDNSGTRENTFEQIDRFWRERGLE